MAEFVTVGSVDDVPEGEARAFDVAGRAIAVAHTEGGAWYALDDTCTHRGCSIAEGELEGLNIVCPCHGGTYDLETGEVLAGPPPEPLATHPVRVEGLDVQVEVGE